MYNTTQSLNYNSGSVFVVQETQSYPERSEGEKTNCGILQKFLCVLAVAGPVLCCLFLFPTTGFAT